MAIYAAMGCEVNVYGKRHLQRIIMCDVIMWSNRKANLMTQALSQHFNKHFFFFAGSLNKPRNKKKWVGEIIPVHLKQVQIKRY